jgi:hypothetical protein
MQKIGWGFFISISFNDSRSDGSYSGYKNHLELQGPYGTCQVTGNDQKPPTQNLPGNKTWTGWVLKGGLDYTWQSDCLIYSGDSSPDHIGPQYAVVWLAFPYLSDEKHLDGKFRLSVTYLCKDLPGDDARYKCTGDRKVDVQVINAYDGNDVRLRVQQVRGIDLQRNAKTQILWFDANNECQFVIKNVDCGN